MENQNSILRNEKYRASIWQLITVIFVLGMILSWLLQWNQWFFQINNSYPLISLSILVGVVLMTTFLLAQYLIHTYRGPKISFLLLLLIPLLSIAFSLSFIEFPKPSLDLSLASSKIPIGIINLRMNLSDEIVVALIIILVWQIGNNLARYQGIQKGVSSQLKMGILMFVFYAFASLLFGEKVLIFPLVSFFFFTLMAMATSRIALVGDSRGGTDIPFSPQWLGGMVSAAFLMITLAIGVGLTLGREVGQGILSLFGKLTQLYFSVIGILFTPVLMLVEWLFGDDQRESLTSDPEDILAYSFTKPTFPDIYDPQIDRENFINIIVLVFGIGIAFYIIRRIQKRINTYNLNYKQVESESIYETSLLSALGKAFKNPLQTIREGINTLRTRYLDNLLASVRIRRIYARFLNLCIDLDIPRRKAQTPLEFLKATENRLPTLGAEIRILTEAYMKVRYGGVAEEESEIGDVESAWKKIQEESKLLQRRGEV